MGAGVATFDVAVFGANFFAGALFAPGLFFPIEEAPARTLEAFFAADRAFFATGSADFVAVFAVLLSWLTSQLSPCNPAHWASNTASFFLSAVILDMGDPRMRWSPSLIGTGGMGMNYLERSDIEGPHIILKIGRQLERAPHRYCNIDRHALKSASKMNRSSKAAVAAAMMVLVRLAFAGDAGLVETSSRSFLTSALIYDGSALANLRGGERTGSTYGGDLQLKVSAHGDRFGLPSTSAFLDVQTIHGGRPSRLVGDAQGTNNLEGPPGTQVEEAWIQHNVSGSSASLLIGVYDLNSEFYRLGAAGLFLNSSFGVGPELSQSGVEGPSIFPRTSAGLRLAIKPTPNTVLRAAILDGVPVVRPDGSHAVFRGGDGILTVLEFAWLSRGASAEAPESATRDRIGRNSVLVAYDDKFAAGAWRYSAHFADLSDTDVTGAPLMRQGSSGVYVLGERLLIRDDAGAGRRLSVFGQAGFADASTNRFSKYYGMGITGSGWGPMRDEDQAGLSIAHARNGSHYLLAHASPPSLHAETTFELSYLTRVSKHVTVQPDIQYVLHPDTDPALANAIVLQLRFEIAY